MKSILKKMKNILKIKLVKKTLALLILLGVGSAFFQSNIIMPQNVYAVESTTPSARTAAEAAIDTPTTDIKMVEKTKTLNAFLKILYIILWPLLALAGLTLDNGMIYGSFFALDAPLWKFRNIMKNFANFTLGFLVLFEIIKSIFSGFDKEKAIGGPMKVIKKALIAGILIQASRFLLAAVIDISTITTYAIGGLPLSVLEKNDELGNKPILGNHSELNLKDYDDINKAAENFDIWYSYGQAKKISKCEIKEGYYIIGLLNGDPAYHNEQYTTNNLELCTYGNILYAFHEYDDEVLKNAKNKTEYSTILLNLWTNNQSDFKGNIEVSSCPSNTDIASLEKISGTPKYGVNLKNCTSKLLAKERAKIWMINQRDKHDGMTTSKMLTKLEGFTGPLVTMYASLMNFAEISNMPKEGENSGAMRIELLVKTFFALALIIPLALLCVVLLARIGILWMVIAFMPFLILIWIFEWKLGGDDGGGKMMNLVASPGKLAGIIFAPVIIVFALSISVIFMTALSNTLNDDAKQHKFFESVGMMYDEETQGINVLNNVETKMKGNETGSDFDNIKSFTSRLFMNLFGIALVWMILFAAIKATSLGKNINDKFGGADKLLGKALSTIPIMSVRGADGQKHGIGIGALSTVLPSALDQKLTRMTNEETSALRQAINPTGSGGPNALDVQKYNALIGSGFSASSAAQTVGFSEKQITESILYQNHVTMHTELDTYSGSAGNEIERDKIPDMTKSNVLRALNSGRLQIDAGSEIQTADGMVHVSSTPAAFGGRTYQITSVDGNKISDIERERARIDKQINDAKEEEMKLFKSNKEFIDILRKKDASKFGKEYNDTFVNPPVTPETE